MQINNEKRDLVKVYILIWVLFVIILSSIAFINWSYLTGYVLGSIVAMCSYLFNEWIFGIWLSNRKTFKNMFILSYLRFIIWAACFIGIVIGILFINKTYNQKSNDLMDWCNGVFDIFLFIVGSSMSFVTIVVHYIAEPIMKWNKKRRTRKEKDE